MEIAQDIVKIVFMGKNFKDLLDDLREKQIFNRQWSNPGVGRGENIEINPKKELWPLLYAQGARFSPYDISDMARVATEGRNLGDINIDGETFPVRLNFPQGTVSTMEDLMALPISVGDKILPAAHCCPVLLPPKRRGPP